MKRSSILTAFLSFTVLNAKADTSLTSFSAAPRNCSESLSELVFPLIGPADSERNQFALEARSQMNLSARDGIRSLVSNEEQEGSWSFDTTQVTPPNPNPYGEAMGDEQRRREYYERLTRRETTSVAVHKVGDQLVATRTSRSQGGTFVSEFTFNVRENNGNIECQLQASKNLDRGAEPIFANMTAQTCQEAVTPEVRRFYEIAHEARVPGSEDIPGLRSVKGYAAMVNRISSLESILDSRRRRPSSRQRRREMRQEARKLKRAVRGLRREYETLSSTLLDQEVARVTSNPWSPHFNSNRGYQSRAIVLTEQQWNERERERIRRNARIYQTLRSQPLDYTTPAPYELYLNHVKRESPGLPSYSVGTDMQSHRINLSGGLRYLVDKCDKLEPYFAVDLDNPPLSIAVSTDETIKDSDIGSVVRAVSGSAATAN